jgi:hypothetical protein
MGRPGRRPTEIRVDHNISMSSPTALHFMNNTVDRQVGLEYDSAAQVLRISHPLGTNRHALRGREAGDTFFCEIPVLLRQQRIERGIYEQLPGLNGYFRWHAPLPAFVAPLTKGQSALQRYFNEDQTIGVGDVVSWIVSQSHKTDGRRIVATGEVISLYDYGAYIRPISKSYIDLFPSRTNTIIKYHKLIVREKSQKEGSTNG